MPYLGLFKGDEVLPPQVPDGTTVECPACGEGMSVVRSHNRGGAFVSRHFSHKSGGKGGGSGDGSGDGDCPGESEIHHKMKAIAYARLENEHPEATIELESNLKGRIPDVLLEFPEPCDPYGKGIAVEAQYRNKGKDKEAVVEHYLDLEYSVAWLEEDDFTTHDVDLSSILSVWPYALPDRYGTEGYPDVTRWLRQEKSPTVEVEVPIPADYWMSFDKSGEWVTIAEKNIKRRGSARISRTPDGHLTFSLGKAKGWGKSESLSVQVVPNDVVKLRSFADDLDQKAFGEARPSPEECDPEWHELSKKWFSGSPTVTTWITAALPDPHGDSGVVVTLWKKKEETEYLPVGIQPYAADNLRDLADLLERAFEIERN
ncbi:hypothetical protein PM032_14175 [Halorubrum ezzemoulense]|uniref:hypothetical protein n=1 Tax=Halorubrum ezzemoulense TaxID=337243 RepID=UPI00232F7B3F|nr:hypothetical protein [Halorubrum ezzemoulense]MDB2272156.1 hypothetical protein [Halorubrum ezzemoulense]